MDAETAQALIDLRQRLYALEQMQEAMLQELHNTQRQTNDAFMRLTTVIRQRCPD